MKKVRKGALKGLTALLFVLAGLFILVPLEGANATCLLEGNVWFHDELGDSTQAHCAFVYLYDSTRTMIDSCCLDENLDYSFSGLPDGEYKLLVVCAQAWNIIFEDCRGYSWYGDTGVIISGEAYKRKKIDLEEHGSTTSLECCHSCPCNEIVFIPPDTTQ